MFFGCVFFLGGREGCTIQPIKRAKKLCSNAESGVGVMKPLKQIFEIQCVEESTYQKMSLFQKRSFAVKLNDKCFYFNQNISKWLYLSILL